MKKSEREAKAEEIARAARAIIQAEEISRRKKTQRLRKLRELTETGAAGSEQRAAGPGGSSR